VFSQLANLGIGIASLIIIFAVVFLLLAQTRAQIVEIDGVNESNSSTFSVGYNATQTLTDAAASVPGWIPLVVIAVIGSILISLVALFRTRS